MNTKQTKTRKTKVENQSKEISVERRRELGLELLETLPIDFLEAYEILKELVDNCKGRGNRLNKIRKCIRLGIESMKAQTTTVSFREAWEASMEAKKSRRKRTRQDLLYIGRHMIKACPELANKPVRHLTPEDCQKWIGQAYSTPSQRKKARLFLSGVFSHAVARQWCEKNPIAFVPREEIKQKRILPLSICEVEELLNNARQLYGGSCLPGCGLMLYAGIRPTELKRLTWDCINLQDSTISILPTHSKTGGARHVTIQPVLKRLLTPYALKARHTPICPKNWDKKWQHVRIKSGWDNKQKNWIPDVLRHTFASYHLAKFRNRQHLQEEMGHSSPQLINTTYVALDTLTKNRVKIFWH